MYSTDFNCIFFGGVLRFGLFLTNIQCYRFFNWQGRGDYDLLLLMKSDFGRSLKLEVLSLALILFPVFARLYCAGQLVIHGFQAASLSLLLKMWTWWMHFLEIIPCAGRWTSGFLHCSNLCIPTIFTDRSTGWPTGVQVFLWLEILLYSQSAVADTIVICRVVVETLIVIA